MNLLFKDPRDRIKKRFMDKMDIFKRNRQYHCDVSRKVKPECVYKLMEFTNVKENDLIYIVQSRSEYIFVPELRGKRTIVFSQQGQTFTQDSCFKSMLPDGSLKTRDRSGVVLDTVYVNDVFWVLDLLLWKDCLLVDCEAEMRSYWLSTKLDSIQDSSFQMLPRIDGSVENWTELLQDWIENDNFDGILVYHKHSYYLSGETSPLCFKISKDLWKLYVF